MQWNCPSCEFCHCNDDTRGDNVQQVESWFSFQFNDKPSLLDEFFLFTLDKDDIKKSYPCKVCSCFGNENFKMDIFYRPFLIFCNILNKTAWFFIRPNKSFFQSRQKPTFQMHRTRLPIEWKKRKIHRTLDRNFPWKLVSHQTITPEGDTFPISLHW